METSSPSAATTDTTNEKPDGNSSEVPGADSAPAAVDSEAKRIDELTRDWRDAQRDRDYWREKALEREGKETAKESTPAKPSAEAEVDDDVKTLADFKYDEREYSKYLRDLARAEAKRETAALKGELEKGRTDEQKAAAKVDFADRAEAWAKEQKLEGADKMFASPKDGGPAVSGDMAELIMASDHGFEVLNYLTRNQAESRRIHKLPPLQQAREIGRLEAKFAAAPSPNLVSGAPPPPPQVSGASDTAATRKDPAKQSDAEWWADKQRREKRKSS